MTLNNLKVGDRVVRCLGGSVFMELSVSKINDDVIVCGAWQFDKKTGAEIDEDLNWGPPPLMTGSFIKPK